MSKAERIRRMNARERVAAQQAAARRAESRRRMLIASGSVLVVIVIVVVLVVVKAGMNNATAKASAKTASAATTSKVLSEITSVPASTLDSVGAGTGVSKLIPTKPGQPLLTSNGKPEIVYMGAEYCPYCAAERWALVVALSRFGTFSGLHLIHSSSYDVFSNTSTLSFYKSTYTSKYISFSPVEMYGEEPGQGEQPPALQQATAAQKALMSKYDAPPYITATDAGSYPFVDFANQYLVLGAQYLPSALGSQATENSSHFGLSWTQIAADLKNPSSPVTQNILGAANSITAAICKVDKNAPAAVCNSAAAKAGAGAL